MNNPKILSVKNLNVKLDKETILEKISFDVNQGEVLIVLGPNGAGKTTLLRTLLGILPYTGEIEWKTNDIGYLPPKELFARKDLPPLNIKEFFALKDISTQETIDTLKSVGLDESILKKEFTKLSTGQFQRMTIAWTLANKPKVLLFDEPTLGIDIGGEETIYSLIHKFWEEHKITIILVTHDLNIVWEHADNILCLNKKSLCHGKPEQILTTENLKKLYGTGIKFYKHRHGGK